MHIRARGIVPDALLQGLEALGEDGAPLPAGQRPSGTLRLRVKDRLPHVTEEHAKIQESHVYADIMHLIDCITEDRAPVASGEHARHVVEVIESGYVASRTGRVVSLQTTF